MEFAEAMELCARGFEVFAVVVLVVGLVAAFALAAGVWRRTGVRRQAVSTLREVFGGMLLLGLEILVAADLIKTVAVDATLESVSVLGLIVLIRTFLSFSLEIEIEGVPPWRRALLGGAAHTAAATRRARDTGAG
jgi:uncharacterized membrane protein